MTNAFNADSEGTDHVRPGVQPAQHLDMVDDWDFVPPTAGSTDPNALGGGDFDLFDPSFSDGDHQFTALGLVDGEEDSELPPDGAQELDEAAQRHLSNSRKGTRKKANLISFDEEDFELGPQRDAFVIVRSYKNQLFGTASTPQQRWKAIEWFFTSVDNGKDVTFDLCCQALGARIDVVRLRIHYEFFLRWWIAPEEFPFLTVPVPDTIDGEVAYVAGEIGRDLATVAWNMPGITTEKLLAEVGGGANAEMALAKLEEKFILCNQSAGNWYLTGRNPYLLRKSLEESRGSLNGALGGSIHWSRLL